MLTLSKRTNGLNIRPITTQFLQASPSPRITFMGLRLYVVQHIPICEIDDQNSEYVYASKGTFKPQIVDIQLI